MKGKYEKKSFLEAATLGLLLISALAVSPFVNNFEGEGNMENKILKKLPMAIAALVATSSGFAASDMESRVDRLEKQMDEVGTDNAFGGFGAKTAIARPSKEDSNWFLTLDLLYWKPFVGGTEFAYTDNNPQLGYPVKGRTKEMSFDWNWGARVGLGYNFNFDGWDLYANYTHFGGGDSKSVSTGGCNNSVVVPLRGGLCLLNNTPSAFIGTKAKSQYDIDFDSIDVQLGRNYFLSKMLSMRPFFGAKIAWIDLEQETRYCGSTGAGTHQFCGTTIVQLGPNVVKIKEDSDFKGAGPEVGFNSKWFLAKGFSFFADALGALCYGFFDVDHREKYSLNSNTRIKLSGNVHRMIPTAQITGGIAYDIFFDDDKQHLGFRIGYDGQYWWRANQMLKIDDAGPLKYERWSEDYSMQGITLQGRWDF